MNSTLFDMFQGLPADPVKLPLFGSPIPSILIILGYLLLVFKVGPDFMEARKPYNVRSAMLIYNFCQIIMNSVFFIMGTHYLFVKKTYNFRCMAMLPSDHEDKNADRLFTYFYFLNKVTDLLDTLFFVLRKSSKQITVLHVYHHALMVLGTSSTYYFYGPGGQYNLMGYLNSFVHAVMYSYYFISAWYPQIKNKLWWKEYITKLQFLQFVILFAQAILTMWLNPGCSFPRALQYVQIAVSTSMMVMFGNFYYQTYVKAKSKQQ
ncbi:elongation of very long chain fatty acids protein F [Drosophila eugracilis]|uniref:elongation of very long chain fatty acids protein F n=1 Tax=Drosophila eugracilis TaxID=29029 RepID=UPI0007E8B3EA|nr:elongation of very long chain fatty acids protein F [Drosophila eugracilis]